jgi:hypothetical protein
MPCIGAIVEGAANAASVAAGNVSDAACAPNDSAMAAAAKAIALLVLVNINFSPFCVSA